jgi:hypothetical protein
MGLKRRRSFSDAGSASTGTSVEEERLGDDQIISEYDRRSNSELQRNDSRIRHESAPGLWAGDGGSQGARNGPLSTRGRSSAGISSSESRHALTRVQLPGLGSPRRLDISCTAPGMSAKEIEDARAFWSEKKKRALQAEAKAVEIWRASGEIWGDGRPVSQPPLHAVDAGAIRAARKLKKEQKKRRKKTKKKERRRLRKERKERSPDSESSKSCGSQSRDEHSSSSAI